ncbi:MAG: hypothetical protein ACYTGH_00735 [Planctomycetota bacterium]|jgi:hypothetical protein
MMENSGFLDEERLACPVTEFVRSLSEEERMLIQIRDELYDGEWGVMQRDLENRLQGKPYLFKLVSRIEHDLQALALLLAYEEEHQINLADHVS